VRTLLVAHKTLLELWREPGLLSLLLLFPAVALTVTSIGFGEPLQRTHPVLICGPDELVAELTLALDGERWPDGRPVFEVARVAGRDEAEPLLTARDADAMLVVEVERLVVRGDPASAHFAAGGAALYRAANRWLDGRSGLVPRVVLAEKPLADPGPVTLFDVFGAGMLVFAVLILVPQTALLVSRELRLGTLRRLRMASLRAGEFLAGLTLAELALAAVQVVIVFVALFVLGFHVRGNLLLAGALLLVICFSGIGLGTVVGGLVQNDGQAGNVGAAVCMIQVVLCGAFFPMPPLTVATVAGHPIGLFDVFPATHGLIALQGVLAYGYGLGDVAFRAGATLALSLVYFAAGVVVFRWVQLRRTTMT
jgi:ABC-2 type transport system permease protein